MNEEEVGAPSLAASHGRGGSPSPIKGPSLLPHKAHLLVKDLSPPLDIPPWSRISEIHVSGGLASGRSCCFRWFAGARRWRLSGGLNVCAMTDALLICGARTSTRSWDRQAYDYIIHEFQLVNKTLLSSRVSSLWMYIHPLLVSNRYILAIVPIVGFFLFSMLQTQQWYQSLIYV